MKTIRKNKGIITRKSIAYALLGMTTMGIIYMSSCTRKNQVLDLPAVVTQKGELVSYKTTVAPSIDGVIDAAWDNATQLKTTTQVPDPGNGLFAGYIGTQYNVTLRSMYDATNVYFLAEIPDVTQSIQVSPWYFNPATKRWAQEPSARTYDVNGKITREG